MFESDGLDISKPLSNGLRRFALITCAFSALLAPAAFSLAAESGTPRYAGPEVCAKCHKDIAAAQSTTAMAKTWNAASTLPLPPGFDQKKIEGPDPALVYEVRNVDTGARVARSGDELEYSVTGPLGSKTVLPVEAVIGGKRHGVSFLARIRDLDGIALARPALIEARYAYSPHGSLVLSPGFQTEKPATLENALGRVLSPTFEQKCLSCHGQPGTLGAGAQGGVSCESCHGPAADHVESLTTPGRQPIRPEPLAGPKSIVVCAQCHTGLSNINQADPVPGDLLVSSQVPALQHSECFQQSGGLLTCTDCHDPHRDGSGLAERSTKTCLKCHAAASPQHASICPVNAGFGCTGCHMPSIQVNEFNVTDHWIAVHPERGVKAGKIDATLRSLVAPKREYLEILATDDRGNAEVARQRLSAGEPFYDVAHATSIDPTASAGGYIGDVQLSDVDSQLADAAAHLWYGETSGIIEQGSRYVILYRLPRDFKWQANKLFLEAVRLLALGDRRAATAKAQAALKVYPYFLRAHIFMATQIAATGDAGRAAYILAFATQSYPSDAFAQYRYALALANQPASQIQAFRRAIELEPDIVAAYESLGGALASSGDMKAAIQVFRQGLATDPLSSILNYRLGVALKQQGDQTGARQFHLLAAKLDPEIAARLGVSAR
ncbi:MAG: cytochrome c3 family protein [Acidobacteriaceae bacterium]|nr:cytochrome c3 family protein [Acidobacteriaceae bacterium]